jgi:dihydroxyacid dehydratase/phosphogluconate dehydratase
MSYTSACVCVLLVGCAILQSYGEYAYDRITEEQRLDIVRNSCPGPGACGGMYTANTMATAIEALGMSLPYSSSTPADDDAKRQEVYNYILYTTRVLV